ncbi:RING finger protein [Clonorchis sinensis]|uniref:RING finger protein n=1 Tax=Clonorchis sinensis TaxID=79923 RepID=G7YUQ7_CLOSI|nr:RING finger protein [Clonorchis sinensis]
MPYYGPRCEHKAANIGPPEDPPVASSKEVTDTVVKRSVDRAMTVTALVFIVITFLGLLLLAWYLSVRRRKDFAQWKTIRQSAAANPGPCLTVDRGVQVKLNGICTNSTKPKSHVDQFALIEQLKETDEDVSQKKYPPSPTASIGPAEDDQLNKQEDEEIRELEAFAMMSKQKRERQQVPHSSELPAATVEARCSPLDEQNGSPSKDTLGSTLAVPTGKYEPHTMAKETEIKVRPDVEEGKRNSGYFGKLMTTVCSTACSDSTTISKAKSDTIDVIGGPSLCTPEKALSKLSSQTACVSPTDYDIQFVSPSPYGKNYYHTLTHVGWPSHKSRECEPSQSPYVNAIDIQDLVGYRSNLQATEHYYTMRPEPNHTFVTYTLNHRSNPTLSIHKGGNAYPNVVQKPLIVASQHDALLSELLNRGSPMNAEAQRASIQSPN